MLHEDALSIAIPYENLILGEPVSVVTRMGTPVTYGMVKGVFSYGAVQVREYDLERGGTQAIADRIYDADLYLFLPAEAPESREIGDPDALERPVLLDPEAYAYPVDEAEEEPAAPKAAPKQKEVRNDDRTASAKVDVNSLPKDLQKRLKGVGDLDEDARDRVLSAISEAAMRAFKAVGVKDTEVYGRIVKLQEVVKPILGMK